VVEDLIAAGDIRVEFIDFYRAINRFMVIFNHLIPGGHQVLTIGTFYVI
jgi:hypothetical protein